MDYPMTFTGSVPVPVDGMSEAQESPSSLLELRNLSVRFAGRGSKDAGKLAVDSVSLKVAEGATLGIVGATGSGKSTVARVVMGMIRPTSGSVSIMGREIHELDTSQRRSLQRVRQVVLQDPYSSLNPRMKVRDLIAEPMLVTSKGRSSRSSITARVYELLDLVGLPKSKANLFPHQFSGGQLQRVSIARALAPKPRLIVLDEPTSALDVSIKAQILNLLQEIKRETQVTYVVISHDMVTVTALASEVMVMHQGRVVESGPVRLLRDRPLHPYTRELLASIPGRDGKFLELPAEAAEAGDAPEAGCLFVSSCSLHVQLDRPRICLEQRPALTPAGGLHRAACHFTGESGTESIRKEAEQW